MTNYLLLALGPALLVGLAALLGAHSVIHVEVLLA